MNWVAPIKDYETLENFKKVLKDIDYKYYIMFELGIGTGLQLQDILTFKNKDVRGKSEITVKIGAKNIENTFTVPEELQKIITECFVQPVTKLDLAQLVPRQCVRHSLGTIIRKQETFIIFSIYLITLHHLLHIDLLVKSQIWKLF